MNQVNRRNSLVANIFQDGIYGGNQNRIGE
jgi:hypothetical protein